MYPLLRKLPRHVYSSKQKQNQSQALKSPCTNTPSELLISPSKNNPQTNQTLHLPKTTKISLSCLKTILTKTNQSVPLAGAGAPNRDVSCNKPSWSPPRTAAVAPATDASPCPDAPSLPLPVQLGLREEENPQTAAEDKSQRGYFESR